MKNKWCVNVVFLFFWGLCVCACTQDSNSSNNSRWSEEKIQEWYDNQPWLVGCNYIPATAINQIEMWSAVSVSRSFFVYGPISSIPLGKQISLP